MLATIQKILNRNREFYYKLTDQADRIIVWLVGFSIASIALSISNEKLINEISGNLSKTIVIFSSITIIFGVLYRTFMYLAQSIENQMIVNFEGYIEGYNNPPDITLPREIEDNETVNNLIYYLKEDFNIDIQAVNENNLSQEQYTKMQNDLFEYYNTLAEINNKHLDSQIDEIKDVLKSNLGLSEKRLERIFNQEKPKINWHKIYWFSIYFSTILFLVTTLVFVSGFITFLICYL